MEVSRLNILQLHQMAGVLQRFLEAEKEQLKLLRRHLRALRFEQIEGEGGRVRFRPASSPEASFLRKLGTFRMEVGRSRIDPYRLRLHQGGQVVGGVPSGLPGIAMPYWDTATAARLLAPALIISILGFMEAISIAKAIAAQTGQRLDVNQELVGQGLANLAAACSHGYAVSGSFSRSAVNFQSGAATGVSSLVTSVSVAVVLKWLTPFLYHIPKATLAAVIIMAVGGLVNFRELRHAYLVKRSDGVIGCITFAVTLGLAPHLDIGILTGLLLSIAVFFYERMRPVIAELSLRPDGSLRNARRFGLKTCSYLAVVRFDGPLFFANIGYLEQEVLRLVREKPRLRAILFKSNGINALDATGEMELRLLIERLHAAGYRVYFSGLKEYVLDAMCRSGLLDRIGEEHIFPTARHAIERIWAETHQGVETAEACPLREVVPRSGAEVDGREGKGILPTGDLSGDK